MPEERLWEAKRKSREATQRRARARAGDERGLRTKAVAEEEEDTGALGITPQVRKACCGHGGHTSDPGAQEAEARGRRV